MFLGPVVLLAVALASVCSSGPVGMLVVAVKLLPLDVVDGSCNTGVCTGGADGTGTNIAGLGCDGRSSMHEVIGRLIGGFVCVGAIEDLTFVLLAEAKFSKEAGTARFIPT